MVGGRLTIEKGTIRNRDDAGRGVDRKAAASGVVERVIDGVVCAVGIAGRSGDSDSRAIGRIFGHAISSGIRVADRSDIEFIDATQYTINGTGPFAYTPGQTIAYNGWSVVLDGAPAAGDTFSVGPTGANSSDNGNAKLLSNLDDARVLNGGTLTLNGAIGGLTTQVGSAARQADYSAQAQQVIHDQAQAARDAVSGVNLDEEAADLMRLQQAYQAASQIIATADTLFQSLLAATRR